jgi:hypothetical protein
MLLRPAPGTLRLSPGVYSSESDADPSGIVHIWISRMTFELETKFGLKQIAKLCASILFIDARRETSCRRSERLLSPHV